MVTSTLRRTTTQSWMGQVEHRTPGVAFSRGAQCTWTSLLLLLYLVAHVQSIPDWRIPVVAIGLLAPIHGVVSFLRCGGDRFSATGVFCLILAMLLTLGVSPVVGGMIPDQKFALAALLTMLVQVWVTPVSPSRLLLLNHLDPDPSAERDGLLQSVALGTFGLALCTQLVFGRGNATGELLALGAIVLISIARAVSPREPATWLIVPGLLTLAYAGLIHSGDGRLRLVSAVFVVLFLGSLVQYGAELKRLTVIALPAGLFGMAWIRLRHVESVRAGLSDGRSGLESGIVPLDVFRQLLVTMADGEVSLAFGSSYVSVPMFLVGRVDPSYESTAIGYELVEITQPARAGSGFSLAGLMMSEWVLNFGLLTLPVLVLLLSLGLRRFDDLLADSWERVRSDASPENIFRMAVVTTFLSGIPDFVWAGSHTLLLRVMLRCIPLAAIALVFVLLDQRTEGSAVSPTSGSRVRLDEGDRRGLSRRGELGQ